MFSFSGNCIIKIVYCHLFSENKTELYAFSVSISYDHPTYSVNNELPHIVID